MNGDRARYRHTQIGYLAILGVVGGGLARLKAARRAVRVGRRRAWSSVPGLLVFMASLATISSLTTEVTDDAVRVWFTFGLFRRTIPLSEVQETAVVTVPWYVGRGVRYWRGGWLYCVWGRRAVRLTLAGGRPFAIGTEEPELLQAAIEEARAALAA